MKLDSHFVAHGERRVMKQYAKQKRGHARRLWVVRAICGHVVANLDTLTLRESNTVSCATCMVMKDAWLTMPKRKPLTNRRANALRRSLRQ